jgi:hypothetical protein
VDYQEIIAELDLRRFKFVDESGVNLAMTRLYGRAPRGERVVGSVPQNYGSNITILASLGFTGLGAMMTVEGATEPNTSSGRYCGDGQSLSAQGQWH